SAAMSQTLSRCTSTSAESHGTSRRQGKCRLPTSRRLKRPNKRHWPSCRPCAIRRIRQQTRSNKLQPPFSVFAPKPDPYVKLSQPKLSKRGQHSKKASG